ncbi:hypothetical protein ACQV2E_11705 [Pantoea allii]|uniref:Uncharacterized protein n=1 Tax=Pantoea allii TaxID=574096 RepID=A0A2V2BB41_9GAMM|nr:MULTISPECIES: hypothetical protein [Pantoea]TWD42705.1 hypothetical protein FBY13_103107 [Pantoea sp. SJZ147]MBW1213924.1 hypothetical protein [Pantoea allii]MBW1253356.1 hypothetical protein [Pantoea allii]MBW1258237.1 hypothetical protein [Pantoea allii]MBW1262548.1 hypothetical protein [Pantoea allii]
MNNIPKILHEDILKIVGRAVLTLHLYGESLSADKVASMIECYAEDDPVAPDGAHLYALAMELMSKKSEASRV